MLLPLIPSAILFNLELVSFFYDSNTLVRHIGSKTFSTLKIYAWFLAKWVVIVVLMRGSAEDFSYDLYLISFCFCRENDLDVLVILSVFLRPFSIPAGTPFLSWLFFLFLWIEMLPISNRPYFRLLDYIPDEAVLELYKFWRARFRINLFLLLLFSYILYSISEATGCPAVKFNPDATCAVAVCIFAISLRRCLTALNTWERGVR
jgi:hypothetical protein